MQLNDMLCTRSECSYLVSHSKKRGKDQEPIQSRTTPVKLLYLIDWAGISFIFQTVNMFCNCNLIVYELYNS